MIGGYVATVALSMPIRMTGAGLFGMKMGMKASVAIMALHLI